MSRAFLIICLTLVAAAPVAAQNQATPPNKLELRRVLQMAPTERQRELRSLVAGGRAFLNRSEMLRYENRLRPDLRSLVADPEVGECAVYWLALIGDPEDLRFIMQSPPPPRVKFLEYRWADAVAWSFLDPGFEDDWEFLRDCVTNKFGDGWADFAAIQTLKLIASPRSRAILVEAQSRNPRRLKSLARALEYIDSHPAPLESVDLNQLVPRVGAAIKFGDWVGTGQPYYSETGSKAFVDYEFATAEDEYTYTGTFHRIGEIWKVRGVRETMQAFALRVTFTLPNVPLPDPPAVLPPVSLPSVPPLFQSRSGINQVTEPSK